MLRTFVAVTLLGALFLGCSKKPDLNPPDAPVIPPSTRTKENPGMPPKPGEAPPVRAS